MNSNPVDDTTNLLEATGKLKERPETLGARAMAQTSQLVPGLLMGTAMRSLTRATIKMGVSVGMNTTVTNVPGPREPLSFAGASLVMLFAMLPVFDGAGLMHSVSSYVDHFMVSITADREMMPDPAFYADCIVSSHDELSDATR